MPSVTPVVKTFKGAWKTCWRHLDNIVIRRRDTLTSIYIKRRCGKRQMNRNSGQGERRTVLGTDVGSVDRRLMDSSKCFSLDARQFLSLYVPRLVTFSFYP